MSELNKTLEQILESYIYSLDNGEENRESLLRLKEAGKNSTEARDYYQEARINQFFHYRRLVVARETDVMERALLALKEVSRKKENFNIWAYFNELRENKKLSWKETLSRVKLDPKLACDIEKEEMDLLRISPRILARIATLLEAEPKKVTNLAYRFFVENQGDVAMAKAVAYRVVREAFIACETNSGGNLERKDEGQQEVIKYLRELEELLS